MLCASAMPKVTARKPGVTKKGLGTASADSPVQAPTHPGPIYGSLYTCAPGRPNKKPRRLFSLQGFVVYASNRLLALMDQALAAIKLFAVITPGAMADGQENAHHHRSQDGP